MEFWRKALTRLGSIFAMTASLATLCGVIVSAAFAAGGQGGGLPPWAANDPLIQH